LGNGHSTERAGIADLRLARIDGSLFRWSRCVERWE
jgi:hypothetical protein